MKLHSRCRDMEDRVLTIRFNSTTCRWELVDEGAPWEDAFKTDPDLKKVIEHVKEQGMFIGLASELCELLQLSKKPQSISGKLYNRRGQLKKMGILFGRTRTREGSMLTLFTEANPVVKKDACDDVCRSDDFSSPDDMPYEIVTDDCDDLNPGGNNIVTSSQSSQPSIGKAG